MFIIIFIIGILIGSLGIYLCLRNKLYTTQVLDTETLNLNHKLQEENGELNRRFKQLTE